MSKRLSEIEKEEILKSFFDGKTIEELSDKFKCTKLTISRNIKKKINEKEYKEILIKNENESNLFKNSQNKIKADLNKKDNYDLVNNNKQKIDISENEGILEFSTFTEIIPLNQEIDNLPQKDLTSVHISEIDFPKIVYMIVDKKIELITKFLKEYPEWQFLSQNELDRNTIEIYKDLKIANRHCGNNQKVIKVPNTEVFFIVSNILISRGISRIISEKTLIAL